MAIADDLQKLVDMRQAGRLSEAEFAAAKRRLLEENGSPPVPEVIAEHETIEASPARGPGPEPAPERPTRTYSSSRWSAGNHFFPDRLTVAADGITFHKGQLIGSSKEHINYKKVASVRVENGLLFAKVWIETSGGSQTIFLNGLWKSDAHEIQQLVRAFEA